MATGIRVLRRASHAYGRRNRQAKVSAIRKLAAGIEAESLLLVGVSCRNEDPGNNLVERSLLDVCRFVTASGLHEDNGSWPHYVKADALELAFGDQEFDLVVSNAVIEHVGGEQKQRKMLAEVARVGRSWVVTTPNRWFPVEAHHHTLFSHWRRAWAPTAGSVTRLLGIREFEAMLPDGRVLGVPMLSPTLMAVHRAKGTT